MRVVRLVRYLFPLAPVARGRVHRALQRHVCLRLAEEVVAAVHLLDGLQSVRVADVLLRGGQEVLLGLVVGHRRGCQGGDFGVLLAVGLLFLVEPGCVEVLVLTEPLPVDFLSTGVVAELSRLFKDGALIGGESIVRADATALVVCIAGTSQTNVLGVLLLRQIPLEFFVSRPSRDRLRQHMFLLALTEHGRGHILLGLRQMLIHYRPLYHSLRLLRYLLILVVLHGLAVDGYQPAVVVLGDDLWH